MNKFTRLVKHIRLKKEAETASTVKQHINLAKSSLTGVSKFYRHQTACKNLNFSDPSLAQF